MLRCDDRGAGGQVVLAADFVAQTDQPAHAEVHAPCPDPLAEHHGLTRQCQRRNEEQQGHDGPAEEPDIEQCGTDQSGHLSLTSPMSSVRRARSRLKTYL